MKVRFWGVRGSFPVAVPNMARYGGNTPSVEVLAGAGIQSDAAHAIVIDAGTGIRDLGRDLVERGVQRIDLLLSHTHWDHIQGFPHFAPLQHADRHVTVHALRRPQDAVADLLAAQQGRAFFPLALEDVPAQLCFVEHEEGERFAAGPAQVTCHRLNHPGVTGGFRVEFDGRVLAYVCDTDLDGPLLHAAGLAPGEDAAWLRRLRRRAGDLAHRADLLVCDTFFRTEEYNAEWGHSRAEDFVRLSDEAEVAAMCLFHHRPHRTDAELDTLVTDTERHAGDGFDVLGAREGLQVTL